MRVGKEQRKAFALAAGFGVLSMAGFFFIPVILDGDENTKITQSISLLNSINVQQALGPVAASLYSGVDQKISKGDVFISEKRSLVYTVKEIRQLSDGQHFIVADVKDVTKFKDFRTFVLSTGKEHIINLYDFLNDTEKAPNPGKQVRELFVAYNRDVTVAEFASVAEPDDRPTAPIAAAVAPPDEYATADIAAVVGEEAETVRSEEPQESQEAPQHD